MSEKPLKPGWKRWRFDQMATNVNERIDDPSKAGVERYVGLEHIDPESLRIRRWGSPSDVEATKLIFRKGDIIFGRRRAYQRKLAVADFDGICSAHAMVLRAKTDVVLSDFLPFLMQSDLFMHRAQAISVGSLSPTINWTTLAKEEFALPPREEQKRIIQILKSTSDTIDSYTTLSQSASQCRQSYLATIFDVKVGNIQRFGHFSISKKWKFLTLPELVKNEANSLTAGPFGTIFKAKDFRGEGIPIIQLRHITDNGFDFGNNLTYMDVDVYNKTHRPFTVKGKDLLITKLGDPPGLACIYPEHNTIGMVTPDVIKATLNEDIIIPSFSPFLFNNVKAKLNIMKLCKGGTRTRVSLGEFYKLLWPIPSIQEQIDILIILDGMTMAVNSYLNRPEIAIIKDSFLSL